MHFLISFLPLNNTCNGAYLHKGGNDYAAHKLNYKFKTHF